MKKYMNQEMKRAMGPVPKDKRIYLRVDYRTRRFSEYSNCRFDPDKKLWFTGVYNPYLESLILMYGIDENTSETALALMKEILKSKVE